MKKLLIVILALSVVLSIATHSPAPLAFAAVATFIFMNSYKQGYAMLIIVPAKMDGPAFSRCQKFLYDFLAQRGNELTKAAIVSGNVIWDPVTYYIRTVITGLSGRQKFFQASTTKAVGTTNLDKAILPQYYNFCYDRITVRYGSTNTASAAVASFAGYSSVLSSMDPALRNGHLIVSLNREIQIETPIIDFGVEAAVTGGGARDFSGGILEAPKVWVENLQIEAEFDFAGTIPSVANTTYFAEVAFQGVQARLS